MSTGYTWPSNLIFNFGHSGTLVLSHERQSAKMSEIKNIG